MLKRRLDTLLLIRGSVLESVRVPIKGFLPKNGGPLFWGPFDWLGLEDYYLQRSLWMHWCICLNKLSHHAKFGFPVVLVSVHLRKTIFLGGPYILRNKTASALLHQALPMGRNNACGTQAL